MSRSVNLVITRLLLQRRVSVMSSFKNSTGGNFLCNEPKYDFLQDLGIEKCNKGVYNGKWSGNGKVTIIKQKLIKFNIKALCFFLCFIYPLLLKNNYSLKTHIISNLLTLLLQ